MFSKHEIELTLCFVPFSKFVQKAYVMKQKSKNVYLYNSQSIFISSAMIWKWVIDP